MSRTRIRVTHSSTVTRVLARALVISQLFAGLPAIAAPAQQSPEPTQVPATAPADPPKEERRITPNRTVPKVTPPPTIASLSATPSDAELTRMRIFAEPLVPMSRGGTPAENAALTRAIREY